MFLPQTNPALGHCGYLNVCHQKALCKYMHFEIDTTPPCEPFVWECGSVRPYGKIDDEMHAAPLTEPSAQLQQAGLDAWLRTHMWEKEHRTLPAQWIECDIRSLDLDILGKFDVIVADPPWDIHMSCVAKQRWY